MLVAIDSLRRKSTVDGGASVVARHAPALALLCKVGEAIANLAHGTPYLMK
jgi:hypothetical protein